MFTQTITPTLIVKRYKCHWIEYNGIRNNVYRRRILHGETLAEVKEKAIILHGSKPNMVVRI